MTFLPKLESRVCPWKIFLNTKKRETVEKDILQPKNESYFYPWCPSILGKWVWSSGDKGSVSLIDGVLAILASSCNFTNPCNFQSFWLRDVVNPTWAFPKG